MHSPAADIARRLAEDAEAVCRHYLSNGRKQGRYWIVGDVQNTPGRSLYVRLSGPTSGPGAAGKWTDSATGQHGDLLDLIALNMGITTLKETLEEARRFLKPAADGLAPRRQSASLSRLTQGRAAALGHGPADVGHLGRTLSRRTRPHRAGPSRQSPVSPELLLLARGSRADRPARDLARPARQGDGPRRTAHRPAPHLARSRHCRTRPRSVHRARPWAISSAMVFASENRSACWRQAKGWRRCSPCILALPKLPVVAALSANHLAALQLPADLRRLYIAVDADPAGLSAADQLAQRAMGAGIDAIHLSPHLGDFNDDLRANGRDEVARASASATGARGCRDLPRQRHRLIGIGAAGQRLRDQSHAFRPSESGRNGAEPGRARNGKAVLRCASAAASRGATGTPANADPSRPRFSVAREGRERRGLRQPETTS
jgi:hypothetical protein